MARLEFRKRLCPQVIPSAEQLFVGLEQTIQAWSRSLEIAGREPEGHPYRVAELTLRLARKLGYPEDDLGDLVHGALLHDVGMLGVPESILRKPGRLDETERALVEQHPTFARLLLEPVDILRTALDIPLHHHERWDGLGYPNRLSGEQIPLPARLFMIADVWDALLSDQPYRAAWDPAVAREHLAENKGRHFDPELVDAFIVMVSDPNEMSLMREDMVPQVLKLPSGR